MMDQRTMEPIIEANSDQTTDLLVGVTSGHPLGTTIGVILGASTACATAAVLGGPLWAVFGAIAGAITGGLGGRAIAEIVEPRDFESRSADRDSKPCESRVSPKMTNERSRQPVPIPSMLSKNFDQSPIDRCGTMNRVNERSEP